MRSTAARLALPAALSAVVLLAVLAGGPAAAQPVDDERTTIAFDLRADGDARVSVTLRLALADRAERDAFDELAGQHAAGRDSPLSIEPFERAADLASEATGRPMAVRAIDRRGSRTNDTGRLVLAFTWTNFTRVDDGRLLLGDAFRRPGGTWLPGLEAGQELRISFPDGYSAQDISVPGNRFQVVNATVQVTGPATFEPGTPSIVLRETGAGPTGSISPPIDARLGFLAVVAIGAAAILVYRYRDRLGELPGGDQPEFGAPTSADGEPPDPMEEPLLSDEERVLALLESNDGRMKQVEIVEATDWSNAKVSQLLSEMEEAGQVDKLRIGRENLISLPGQGPGGE